MEDGLPKQPKEKPKIIILSDEPLKELPPPIAGPKEENPRDPRVNGLMGNIYLSDAIDKIAKTPPIARELISEGDFITDLAGKLVAKLAEHPNFRAEAQTALVESITGTIPIPPITSSLGISSGWGDIRFAPNEVVEARAPIVARADEALRERAEEIIQGFAATSPDPYIAARQEKALRQEGSTLAGIGKRLDTSWKDSLEEARYAFRERELSLNSIKKKIPDMADPEARLGEEMLLEANFAHYKSQKDRMEGVINGTISPYSLTEDGVAARDEAIALAKQCRVDLSLARDWKQGVDVDRSEQCATSPSVPDHGVATNDVSPKR